jgi:hypothetical protein
MALLSMKNCHFSKHATFYTCDISNGTQRGIILAIVPALALAEGSTSDLRYSTTVGLPRITIFIMQFQKGWRQNSHLANPGT